MIIGEHSDLYLKIDVLLLSVLLYDYDILLFCEAGVRGGITQAVKLYAKPNNKTTPEYNKQKPDKWITYLDATNL